MKQTISNASQFRDAFSRASRQDQFTYEALGLLFEHLDDNNPEYELDVVEICCDYSEDTPESIIESYGIESDDWDGICTASVYGLKKEAEAKFNAVIAYLEANTTIVGTTSSGAIVYASDF
jgi:hypothetical protein